ncbi:AAA family ATPase [Paenibacillus doosanensis]|uniref:ATP-dependent zinc metalloprotease FtsH n=1 Tax=Paenibacillus konkukensis TaxID=2020716 RepID=A0ABY4RHH4_9BACL|nr:MULTISPECIES: AAA family ATPase [Paenibacillus]MCS7462517.1 AAA family ATPase [Paenibacillus doosanensis]UQZ81876.1 ATP-dependent zinc metalloprotease FtsH [Paenibacillus konkukensis]
MSKIYKEIFIGTVPVVIIFLFFIGINAIPLVFAAVILGTILYMNQMRGGSSGFGGSERKARTRKAPAYLTFDDIGGQQRAKIELKEALDFLIKHEEIRKLGIRPLKGILLEGPPGTGKTLLAKAAAHYTNSVFIAASGSEFVEMYVGVGASRVRELFKEARSRAAKENKESAIVFIDEIDVIGGKRDGGQHREYDQTLNQLLTEMDGIHTTDSPRILLMAATNRKEMLDSALLRPGRFDRHIEVDLPDKKGRLHILNIHGKNKPLSEQVNLEMIAEETFQFSGAQLESVMNEAAIYAMREESPLIEQKHLSQAVDKVMIGERTDRESTKEERDRVALHELGHAIAAENVRPGSVSQVALSPRGKALGYVRHNPQQDQYLYTKEQLEEQIIVALGGAVAEEMFYGGRSTGSRNDFEQSLHLVRTMMDSGLTNLGIIDRQMVTKEELMKENAAILEQLTERTREILERHRIVFEQSLSILVKEEVLSGDQFRQLLEQSRLQTA